MRDMTELGWAHQMHRGAGTSQNGYCHTALLASTRCGQGRNLILDRRRDLMPATIGDLASERGVSVCVA